MICAMIGCSNRSDRDDVRFFRLPKVVTDRGEQMLSLTTERQLAWLRAISRDDITKEKLSNVFVREISLNVNLLMRCTSWTLIGAHLNTLGMIS